MKLMDKITAMDRMVDIETYDNICTAAIASIGAVKFNVATREVCDEFYCTIDPRSCKEYGLTFGEDTLNWWKQQSIEARQALRIGNIPLPDALEKFSEWYKTGTAGKICCWGMFDVPTLSHAYRKVGMDTPWLYWATIECRSVSDLLNANINRSVGVYHNALNDAVIQANHMINILNPLEEAQ